MRVTIIPQDKSLGVDGLFLSEIDYSDLDPTIHAIQWDGARGEIEYITDPDTDEKKPNFMIVDFSPYQKYVDQWTVLNEARLAEEAGLAEEANAGT